MHPGTYLLKLQVYYVVLGRCGQKCQGMPKESINTLWGSIQLWLVFKDNFLTVKEGLAHHGETAELDKEISTFPKNLNVILWLEKSHIELPGKPALATLFQPCFANRSSDGVAINTLVVSSIS